MTACGTLRRMAYELRALVCAQEVATRTAARLDTSACHLVADLHIVPLPGRTDSDARQESTSGDPMLFLTPEVEALAVDASAAGPIAYVEAEFFGSAGTQAAAVWQHGLLVFGPATWEYSAGETRGVVPAELPINTALRKLGVGTGQEADEFDTAGLGRHRFTEEWLGGQPD